MGKKWRPEGWEKTVNLIIWENSYGHGEYNTEGIADGIADAMLEALRKTFPFLYAVHKGDIVQYISFPFGFVAPYDGHFVFIPDEGVEDNDKEV